MSPINDPVLILSVEDARGQVGEDPRFVAVVATPELCARLQEVATLCKRHRLHNVDFDHEGVPPYWDAEGRLAGFVADSIQWGVGGGCASVSLWARLPTGN